MFRAGTSRLQIDTKRKESPMETATVTTAPKDPNPAKFIDINGQRKRVLSRGSGKWITIHQSEQAVDKPGTKKTLFSKARARVLRECREYAEGKMGLHDVRCRIVQYLPIKPGRSWFIEVAFGGYSVVPETEADDSGLAEACTFHSGCTARFNSRDELSVRWDF